MQHLFRLPKIPAALRRIILCSVVPAVLALWWIFFCPWPDPEPVALPWKPDTILILGGGDAARARQGILLFHQYPDARLMVSGDGGYVMKDLLKAGIPVERIHNEETSTSTVENALHTAAELERTRAQRVVLVTNWFHAPRALAVFRKIQPGRDFSASFETKREPLTIWDKESQRRERLAAVWYLLRYGIWSGEP